MVRQTTQDRINCRIKFKICSIYFYILKKDKSLQLAQDYKKLN